MKVKKLRILSFLLAFLLVLTPLCSFAVAADNEIPTISKEDLFISEDVAKKMALLFISDTQKLPDVTWDEHTAIVDTVTMYDGTTERNITAYSFELDKGYVVVSAYLDVPTLILEWSDKASPLYDQFDLSSGDDVVYVGSMYYYKDSGDSRLESLTGEAIARADVTNILEEKSSFANVPTNALTAIRADKEAQIQLGKPTPGSDSVITDPFDHAEEWYNGPFVCNDYQNKWENYVECKRATSFSNLDNGYTNHCGPTAITNLLIMYGNRYHVSNITSKTANQIFSNVASIGISNTPDPYYTCADGTYNSSANDYIIDCFDSYGVNITVNGRYAVNYTNIEISLRNNRLLYVMMLDHDCYGDHHVICYAYTRLVSETDGSYVTYLKVADGWSTSPRYIDLASLNTDKYWEVER